MSTENRNDVSVQEGGTGCRFCPANLMDRVVAELDSVWAVEDRYPVSKGHHLIVPKRHTAFHAHIHLIPRRDGDTQEPAGGVRGVIPGRMSYLCADSPAVDNRLQK